jgi:hypothetical protein
MVNVAVSTLAASATGVGRRTAARSLASSSFHPEGLGDIVVRAGVEGAYLRLFFVSGREDDDRGGTPSSESFDDGDTIKIRQPEVQDHHIGWRKPNGSVGPIQHAVD